MTTVNKDPAEQVSSDSIFYCIFIRNRRFISYPSIQSFYSFLIEDSPGALLLRSACRSVCRFRMPCTHFHATMTRRLPLPFSLLEDSRASFTPCFAQVCFTTDSRSSKFVPSIRMLFSATRNASAEYENCGRRTQRAVIIQRYEWCQRWQVRVIHHHYEYC